MDYFAANDSAAYTLLGGNSTETTNGAFYNGGTSGSTKAILNNGSTALGVAMYKSAPFINPTTGAATNLTDAWLHFDMYNDNKNSSFSVLEVLNSVGTPVVRVAGVAGAAANMFRVEYWNGAAWVSGSPSFATAVPQIVTFDVHMVAGVGGSLDFYINQTLVGGVAGLNAAVTNFSSLQLCGGTNHSFSQVLVSDVNTIGAKVATLTPNANSATNTAWANDYTNLVKTGYNDATLVSSSVLNDAESYGATDVALPTAQYSVSSLWFSIRGRLAAATPQNVKPLLRIGGVNYNGAYNFANLNGVSFANSIAAFANDPSTAAAWAGVTNLNAAELGFITQA